MRGSSAGIGRLWVRRLRVGRVGLDAFANSRGGMEGSTVKRALSIGL